MASGADLQRALRSLVPGIAAPPSPLAMDVVSCAEEIDATINHASDC
jgi:hypothetical protein